METLEVWKQSLEMPGGSGDELWCARKWKGEVEKALIRRATQPEQILSDSAATDPGRNKGHSLQCLSCWLRWHNSLRREWVAPPVTVAPAWFLQLGPPKNNLWASLSSKDASFCGRLGSPSHRNGKSPGISCQAGGQD